MPPLTQDQIRQIIREELSTLIRSDRYVFIKNIEMLNGRNMQLGTVTGTDIGTTTSEKLGFYGTAPIIQRSGAAQVAVVTTASTQTTPFGYATAAQADAIVTLVNELRAWAVAQGFIKGSA